MLRAGRTQEGNRGHSRGDRNSASDARVRIDDKIFDRTERMAVGIGCNPCGDGEHGSVLEASDQHP